MWPDLKGKFLGLFGFEALEIPKEFRDLPVILTARLSAWDQWTCQDRLGYAAVINNPRVPVPVNQRLLSHSRYMSFACW